MSSRIALRVSAEDFPTPTAISVSWPDAGVVFFVDVCRSQYETAPPSVWMLDQPTLPENNNNNNNHETPSSQLSQDEEEEDNNSTELFSLQVSKNSSVSFRCSYFVPKIVNNNVLVLLIGDACASSSSSSSSSSAQTGNNNNNNSPHHSGSSSSSSTSPFFGVCASLLPPPELVRQHGVDAFASFSFAWLCGPEITSMRPAPRVSFASCCTTIPTNNSDRHRRSTKNYENNNNNNTKPNASIWVHGGLPFAPTMSNNNNNNNNNNAKSYYEPLSIFPDQYSDSDTFLLGTSSSSSSSSVSHQEQHADKYLRKAVTEDFYGMFELKLCIIGNQLSEQSQQHEEGEAEGSVSVYPWIRHPGLPLICHHSISSIQLPRNNKQSSSSSSSKLFLIIFGGLKLDLWKSQRSSDLLPTFKNNEFTISNTFYIYDVEEENWEWKDAVITSTSSGHGNGNNNSNNKQLNHKNSTWENPSDTAVAAALIKTAISTAEKLLLLADGGEQNNNVDDVDDFSLSLVGARPPPVFDHKIIEIVDDDDQNQLIKLKSFLIYGGLRGRFTEKSKEIWSFGTNSKTRLIQCNQQTAPPTINNNNNNNDSNNQNQNQNQQHQHLFFLFNRIWAIDLKKKLMWCQKIDQDFFVENNNNNNNPISSSSSPTRNLNFNDNNNQNQNQSSLQGGKFPWEGPISVVSGTLKRQNRNSRGRSLDFENPPPMIVQMNYPRPSPNRNNNHNHTEEESIIDKQFQQRDRREQGASSPATTNALMDAFEF